MRSSWCIVTIYTGNDQNNHNAISTLRSIYVWRVCENGFCGIKWLLAVPRQAPNINYSTRTAMRGRVLNKIRASGFHYDASEMRTWGLLAESGVRGCTYETDQLERWWRLGALQWRWRFPNKANVVVAGVRRSSAAGNTCKWLNLLPRRKSWEHVALRCVLRIENLPTIWGFWNIREYSDT